MIFIWGVIAAIVSFFVGHFVAGYELTTGVVADPGGYWFWLGGLAGMILYVLSLVIVHVFDIRPFHNH